MFTLQLEYKLFFFIFDDLITLKKKEEIKHRDRNQKVEKIKICIMFNIYIIIRYFI